MLVIACVGVIGWLLMLTITLCLGAAAKRGDGLEQDTRRYLPDSGVDAEIIPLRPKQASENRPPAFCGRRYP